MITAGPPDGSGASASAAENVAPSADVSSSVSAPAPPAMRGWRTRSSGRSGGWASKAKHTEGSPRLDRAVRAGSYGRSAVFAALALDLPALAAAAVVVAVLAG